MKDKLDQIRVLATELEKEIDSLSEAGFLRDISAMRVPGLVVEIVDFVVPDLFPHEAAFYWYLFRHSLLKTGRRAVYVHPRDLAEGVVTSSSGRSLVLSDSAVAKALKGLEDKGAISRVGDDPDRGVLYKVFVPSEIPFAKKKMSGEKAPSR